MRKSLGSFRAALLIGWIVLGAAGLLYARWKAIPQWAAVPVLAAFLLEYLFYLAPDFEAVRESSRQVLEHSNKAYLLTQKDHQKTRFEHGSNIVAHEAKEQDGSFDSSACLHT